MKGETLPQLNPEVTDAWEPTIRHNHPETGPDSRYHFPVEKMGIAHYQWFRIREVGRIAPKLGSFPYNLLPI